MERRSRRRKRSRMAHLGHVLGDDEQAAVLLHDHAEQLHQIVVSELPEWGWEEGKGGVVVGMGGGGAVCLHASVMKARRAVCSSRHDGGLGDEGLRRGVVLDALDGHFGSSVVAHHHICNHQPATCDRCGRRFLFFLFLF